jgi:hypothetical protein
MKEVVNEEVRGFDFGLPEEEYIEKVFFYPGDVVQVR